MSIAPLPHLLPQNRKLRHLRGISLRNLNFSRPRDQSIDDSAISKSSSKLEGLKEASQIHHARSSENLRGHTLRRRSTNLSNASPLSRQRMLELAIEARAADCFFSLHCGRDEEPIYISELHERATNFDFRHFDLSELHSHATRSFKVTIRVWVRRQGTWSLFIEDEADLRFLNWIGTLPGTHFPQNSIVFHLTDGAYTFDLKKKSAPPKGGPALATSSYNALMRLANLDSSIQDALATQEKLAAQVNEILAKETPNKAPQAEDKAQLTAKYLAQQRRAVRMAEKKRNDLRRSIRARREAIAEGRMLQEKAETDVENAAEKLPSSRLLVAETKEDIRGQRRRICEDLINIFPISPTSSGQPLSFQICGIPLPNTDYKSLVTSASGGEDTLSAALGHVAFVTNSLQYYLGVSLPYEVTPFGSRSTIRDDISIMADSQREFPLHMPRGGSKAQYRFDYAWFLLNKDVEALCVAQGLKVVDIRHTLPNLKYLLYVCSAGSDELPERKKGGIRGLWAGRMQSRGLSLSTDEGSSAGGSRRGSAESELLSKQRDELRRSIMANGTGGDETPALLASSPLSPLGLPFDEEETKLTLRTKGLRENVGK